ncbi:hypothetical protein DEJ25_02040 [Curtobacterium sp. MCPF17_011]|nr:hypothetical protein DEJ31_08435 [Curtobacterium sp. MCPF17_031]PZF15528.1 hypothetical protein DEJ25_02040 [Curtobacterium sp. MCPF17_011]
MNTPGPFVLRSSNESDQLMQHPVRPEDIHLPPTQPIDITAYLAVEADRAFVEKGSAPELNGQDPEPPC